MSTAASQYLREVKKRIHCSSSQKTEFLCQLEAEVIYYCEDHDYVDLAILSEYFGAPDDVAKDFLSEIGIEAANTTNRTKQHVFYFIVSLAVIVIILAAAVEIYTNYKQQQALDGYFVESITYEENVAPYVTSPSYWTDSFGNDNNTEN